MTTQECIEVLKEIKSRMSILTVEHLESIDHAISTLTLLDKVETGLPKEMIDVMPIKDIVYAREDLRFTEGCKQGWNDCLQEVKLRLVKGLEGIEKTIYEHCNTKGYDMLPIQARNDLAHAIIEHLLRKE